MLYARSGRLEYATGQVFDGHWLEDVPHGLCTYFRRNGSSFSGTFTHGQPAESIRSLLQEYLDVPLRPDDADTPQAVAELPPLPPHTDDFAASHTGTASDRYRPVPCTNHV